jgi:hypothetical protein
MKQLALLLIMALPLSGTVWAQQAGSTPASPTRPPSGAPPPGAPPTGANQITPDEWQELRAARSAAFQANPDLVAENRKLSEKMRALEDKINVAMVKADPTIGPIIAKLEANRPHPGAPAGSPPAAPPPVK